MKRRVAGWRIRARPCASAVGFAATTDEVDAQRVAGLGKDETVIAGAQAGLSDKAPLQPADVPFRQCAGCAGRSSAFVRIITSNSHRRTQPFDSHRLRCGLLEVPRQFRQEGLSADRALAEVRAAPRCPFASYTFFLTREPTRDSLLEFSKESAAKRLQ